MKSLLKEYKNLLYELKLTDCVWDLFDLPPKPKSKING